MEDTPAGGTGDTPTVPPDVYDRNFGPNYSIIYSGENLPGAYNFDGGLGADQYTGYQGDGGNFGGVGDGVSVASAINENNAIGGVVAQTQYQDAQLVDGGNLAGECQNFEINATKAAQAAPDNAGGDFATGAYEVAASDGAQFSTAVGAFVLMIASIAAVLEVGAISPILAIATCIYAAAALATYALGYFESSFGINPGPGFIPDDANTRTFFNGVGRLFAQGVRTVAAWYTTVPYNAQVASPVLNGTASPNLLAPNGAASPHLLASIGSFTKSVTGQPIFTVPPAPTATSPVAAAIIVPKAATASLPVPAAVNPAQASGSAAAPLLAKLGLSVPTALPAPSLAATRFAAPARAAAPANHLASAAAVAHASSFAASALPLHLTHA